MNEHKIIKNMSNKQKRTWSVDGTLIGMPHGKEKCLRCRDSLHDFIKKGPTLVAVKRERYLEMSDLEKRKVRAPTLLLLGQIHNHIKENLNNPMILHRQENENCVH